MSKRLSQNISSQATRTSGASLRDQEDPGSRVRKSLWAAILFVALLSPFLAVGYLAVTQPSPSRIVLAERPENLIPPGSAATTKPFSPPQLFAAGDGRTLYLLHPIPPVAKAGTSALPDETAVSSLKNANTYELLTRPSNTPHWSRISIDGARVFNGTPDALAVPFPSIRQVPSSAFVLTDGAVASFSKNERSLEESLPPGEELLAATGDTDRIIILTVPIKLPAATAPSSEPFVLDPAAALLPTSEPATLPATSMPAILPAAIEPAGTLHAYTLVAGGHWQPLAHLSGIAPTSTETVAIAAAKNTLLVAWMPKGKPGILLSRTLNLIAKSALEWTSQLTTPLPSPLANRGRLFAMTVDSRVILLWPTIDPSHITLRGFKLPALLTSDFSHAQVIAPMQLNGDVSTADDIAVAPSENAIAVVAETRDAQLVDRLFDSRGTPLSDVNSLSIREVGHDADIIQNVLMLLLILIVALSLWQWRQQPLGFKIPAGMRAAPLSLRALGLTIDLLIPFIVIITYFNMFDPDQWVALLSQWASVLGNPQLMTESRELIYLLALYLTHVTIGELFFRRSIGKAIVGTQILMINGTSPTIAAILVRNLARLPEIFPGILMIYIFISGSHQRLGDMLARTIVVSPRKPTDAAVTDEEVSRP